MSEKLKLSQLLEDIIQKSKEFKTEIDELPDKDREFFEKIRKTTNFKDLNSMFKRWQKLIHYNSGGKR